MTSTTTCQIKDLGDLEGARGLLESALASAEKSYEAGHPSIAARQSNLALVLKDLGDLEGARGLLESALASFKAKLPKGHSYIQTVEGDLAGVLQAMSNEPAEKT